MQLRLSLCGALLEVIDGEGSETIADPMIGVAARHLAVEAVRVVRAQDWRVHLLSKPTIDGHKGA